MSIATLITDGFGSFGDIAHIVRHGFDGNTTPAPAPVAPTYGGYWLGDYGPTRRKKKPEELEEIVEEAIEQMDAAVKHAPVKSVAYTELGQIARAYIGNLKAQQSIDTTDIQRKINAIHAHQTELKAKIAKAAKKKQQDDEDEEDAIFILMH